MELVDKIYQMNKKLIIGLMAVAIVLAGAVSVASYSMITEAKQNKPKQVCTTMQLRDKANTNWTVNGDDTVTATFTIPYYCKPAQITYASYKAKNKGTGVPLTAQTLHAHKIATFGPGRHSMTVKVPDCFYQVDLFNGNLVKQWSHPTDAWVGSHGRLIDGKVGGTCEKPVTPVTPDEPEEDVEIVNNVSQEQSQSQSVVNEGSEVVKTADEAPAGKAEALPNTGPGAVVATFFGVSSLSALAYQVISRRFGL